MGGRVPLVLGAVLAALLLAGPAFGATCEVDQISPQEYTKFLQAVYSPDGLLTLTNFGSAERPVIAPISRESVAIVDEASGTYYPVELNTPAAVDVEKSDIFLKNMTIMGPFVLVAVIDDTLRVAKDPGGGDGYGYDKALQERFEGRFEYTDVVDAAKYLREFEWLRQAFLGHVSSGSRVKNIIRTDDFTVTTTCASNACSQEMYSMFSKYMNIGSSAQMIVEFGGGFLWRNLMPSGVKRGVRKGIYAIKKKVRAPVSKMKDAILDSIAKASDDAKVALRGNGKDILGITEGGFSPSRLKELPVTDKSKIMPWAMYVDDVGDQTYKQLDFLLACVNNPSDCGNLKIDKLIQSYDDFLAAMEKAGYSADDFTVDVWTFAKQGEQTVETPVRMPLRDVLEKLKNKELSYSDIDPESLRKMKKIVNNTTENAARIVDVLMDDVPMAETLSAQVNKKISEVFDGGKAGAVAQATFSPLAFYAAKRLTMAPHENPFAALDVYHAPGFSRFSMFGSGLPLPSSWKVGVVYPPADASYVDSFVDILVNNGSDPGDAFKSMISMSVGGIAHKVLSEFFDRDIPTLGLIMTEEESEKYSMGPAIITLGTSTESCTGCILSGSKGGVLTFSAPKDVPFVGSVVEDSNALKDGSTAILFGHHVNFKFSDGAELDIVEAKRRGKSCYETCPLVANKYTKSFFGENPARAMFVLSYVQSLSTMAGVMGYAASFALSYYVLRDCGECVDTEGGYYLHLRAPPQKESQQIFELTADDALSSLLDSAAAFLGQVSDTLAAEVNAFKQRALAESIRNQGAYVQIHAAGVTGGELHIKKLVELWYKPTEMVQNTLNQEGSISGSSGDGRDVIYDKTNGVVRVNGVPVLTNADLARLVYVDNTVPGIVVPAWVIISEFTTDPAFTATKDGYVVRDQEFLQCFASNIPNGKPTTEFFESIMGKILSAETSEGVVSFGPRVIATRHNWSGLVSRFEVGSDYTVMIEASKFEVDSDGNTIKVDLKTEDVNFGTLMSILFENGALYVKDGRILVNVRHIGGGPGSYVQSIFLSPTEDGSSMNVRFTPTPNAPDDVREQIDRVNKMIEQMGGINSILAENGAVALYRDENGVLWLRIYDRGAMQALTVDQAYEILRSVLVGDGKYSRFEVLDGSLQIYRAGESAYLSHVDKSTGQRTTVLITSYEVDANGFVLHTEAGDHIVSVAEHGGTVVALLDGVIYGPVVVPGAVKQEKVLDVYQDPNTGSLIVKTDQGSHTIQVNVDSNGTPQLLLDGALQGIIQAMQGPKGFVSYNPDTGEWSFVAGLLTPLAEAFKNGIKISLDAGGNLAASPAAWSFRPNPYMSSQGGGLSLPLFEGPEIVLLLVAVATIFAIIR